MLSDRHADLYREVRRKPKWGVAHPLGHTPNSWSVGCHGLYGQTPAKGMRSAREIPHRHAASVRQARAPAPPAIQARADGGIPTGITRLM